MGTHPIFESDFDCLTEGMARCYPEVKKSLSNQLLIFKFNSGSVEYQAENLNFIALAERDILPLANQKDDDSISRLNRILPHLNLHLKSRTFLIGERQSLADI